MAARIISFENLSVKFIGRPKRLQRWGHPAQQQGRRIPSMSSVHVLATCCFLVSGFLTEMVQHIHSLRARGVRLSHAASALASETRAFRKSGGNVCTTPSAITFMFLTIRPFYQKRGAPCANSVFPSEYRISQPARRLAMLHAVGPIFSSVFSCNAFSITHRP